MKKRLWLRSPGFRFSVLLALIGLFSGSLRAEFAENTVQQQFQQQVTGTAREFLTRKGTQAMKDQRASRIKVTITPPSSRLPLPACPVTPLVNDLSRKNIGDQRLKLRCPSGSNWSVLVRGEIAIYRPVLVTSRIVERGKTIPDSAVSLQMKNLAELDKGYLTRKADLNHRITRIRIKAGSPIEPSMLETATLVSRGDRIIIRAGIGGVDITVSGEALESGSMNDQVRVRNSVSNKIVYGMVTGDGEVTIKQGSP